MNNKRDKRGLFVLMVLLPSLSSSLFHCLPVMYKLRSNNTCTLREPFSLRSSEGNPQETRNNQRSHNFFPYILGKTQFGYMINLFVL